MQQMTLTMKAVVAAYNTAVRLGDRSLDIGPALKVARIRRALAPEVEAANVVQRKASEEILAGRIFEELPQPQRVRINLAIAAKNDELEAKAVEISLPDGCILKQADLPVAKTGEKGWENAAGLGNIVADLGPFYLLTEPPAA